MTTTINRLKEITFSLDAVTTFNCQIKQWMIANNTEDGERHYTLCPDGETRDEPDDDYALELTFFSDWKTNGISDFLWKNDGATVAFVLDHMPNVATQHVRWTGNVRIKAPSAGGEARANEEQTVTFPVIGKPVYVDNATVTGP
jgi:hypothetical protein